MRTDASTPESEAKKSEPARPTPEAFAKLSKKKMIGQLKSVGIDRGKNSKKDALVKAYRDWYEASGSPSVPEAADDGRDGAAPAVVEDERRKSPRAQINVEIGLQTETNFFVGFSGDISEGGIFVTTVSLLAIDTAVTLSFAFPGGIEIQAEGVVAWTREGLTFDSNLNTGMGIRFTRLDDAALAAIKEFTSIREPIFHEL